MRNILSVALAGFVLLTSASAHAQRKRQAKDSSVTIVFAESARPTASHKRSGEENIVKISPLGFISGTFPLTYERRLTDFFTIEAAGGLSNRNYIRGAFLKEDGGLIADDAYPWSQNPNAGFSDDEAEPLYEFNKRKPEMGYLFRAMPRLYFSDEAPEGSYIGFQYAYTKYKFSIPRYGKSNSGGYAHNGAPVKEYENVTDYMVYFGYQALNDRISLESATGIGMRKVNGMKYTATVINGNLVDGLAPYKQNTFNFGLTLTVGYHF